MHGTAAAPHNQAELTLDATEAANPEWAPWLRLLRRARAAQAAGWMADIGLASDRPPDAPLLHDAIITADPARLQEWLRELVGAAAEEAEDPRTFGDTERVAGDALVLLEAAIELDALRLEALAAAHSCDSSRLSAVMQPCRC
jgi:hypothetical protein